LVSGFLTTGQYACLMAKWRRVGEPFEYGATGDGADIDIGWSWRISRVGAGDRHVRVEVAGGRLLTTDLSDESRRAIRSKGASAVDAVLDEELPPGRLIVASLGVRVQELGD
jgi:hypothetical protein